jgi:hypothetical protein
MEGTKVFIKSIPRDTATKISEARSGTTGKKLNKNKIGRCKDGLRAMYSAKTGKLLTGLTEIVNNPYYGKEKNVPSDFTYIKDLEKCSLQEVLEIKHKVPKGTYTDKPWLPGDGMRESDLTFFQKFRKRLNDGTTILDLSIFHDELAYYMLKYSPLVALSNKFEDRKLKPKCEYYISDINESELEKFSKREKYHNTISKLKDPKFTVSYQAKVAKVLELVRGDVTSMKSESIYLLIDSYIEEAFKSTKDEKLTLFEETYDLIKTAEGKERLEAMCLLSDLIQARILNDNRGTYTWLSKSLIIGQRKNDAIEFMLDPKKQPEVEEMKKQLKAKLLR